MALAADEIFNVAGRVTARSATALSLSVGDKKATVQTFVITEQTVIRRDRNPQTIEDIDVGEMAGIVGRKEGSQLIATSIVLRAKP